MFWQRVHDTIFALLRVERRFEPFFRPAVNAVFREPSAAVIQYLINLQRKDEGYRIAEERIQPDEEQHLLSMIDSIREYMTQHWPPGNYQRGGNTKTHGVVRWKVLPDRDFPTHHAVRGEVTIREDLPPQF